MSINFPIFHPVFFFPKKHDEEGEKDQQIDSNKNKQLKKKLKVIYKKEPDWSKLQDSKDKSNRADELSAWWLYYNLK